MAPITDTDLAGHWRAVAYKRTAAGLVMVVPFVFTWGLVYDVGLYDYRIRYCYATLRDAMDALTLCDGISDPPGEWIKAKGRDLAGLSVDRARVPGPFHG